MIFDPESCRTEREVSSKLIVEYLLPALGYTRDRWHREVAFGRIRPDFSVFRRSRSLKVDSASVALVIEVKHPRKNLDKYVYQIRNYLVDLNVCYGILTNGREIRIYRQLSGKLKPIFSCQGSEIAERLTEMIHLVGRNILIDNSSDLLPSQLSPLQTNTIELQAEPQSKPSMKTIAVYHNKGGVGKTTVSTNLAAAFSRKGYRVLLVDIDAQANSTFATGLVKFEFDEDDDLRDRNVYHVIASTETGSIQEIVRQSEYFSDPEIGVIPAHITLIAKQIDLTMSVASRFRLLAKLKQVENDYNLVIIDTPPSRDIYAEVALITADYLLIPSDLKPFANQGLPTVKEFIKTIDENRQTFGKAPLHLLGVLASKISTNARYIEYTFPKQRAVIQSRYSLPLMESVIYDRTALSESFNKTVIVGELEYPDPKSIFKYADEVKSTARVSAMEFEVLADEILEKIGL